MRQIPSLVPARRVLICVQLTNVELGKAYSGEMRASFTCFYPRSTGQLPTTSCEWVVRVASLLLFEILWALQNALPLMF